MPRDAADALRAEDILPAYALGYFPMARSREDRAVVWVLPDERGVLDLSAPRAPKKLLRLLRREPFDIRFDTAFVAVMEACAEAAEGREETWINDAILEAYSELHFAGHAHSVECWRDGELVGGLYGVTLGGVFCGESMFSREANASKIAMLHLIARLRAGGFSLLDAQFHTEHLAQFGFEAMPSDDYLARMRALIRQPADFNAPAAQSSSATSVWQSITHTS